MADLAVKVKGDTTNLNNALDRAGKKVAKTGQRMENLGSKLSKGISAPMAAAAGATAGLAIKAGRAADKLLDTEQQTGLTTKAIQEYRAVADKAGVSSDALSGAAEMLNQRMRQLDSDSSNASRAFDELNIATKDAQGNLRDNDKMFSEVISKLSDFENQTERNKIASQLFGNRWRQIAPVLGMSSEQIEKTKDSASGLGQVLSKDTIEAANSFRQAFDSLSRTVSTLFTRLGAKLAPVMENTVIPIFRDKVVPALQSAVETVGKMADKFGSLPQPVKNTALALTGLAVAMPPVILGGGKILKILPKAFRAMAASAKISAATTKRALISTGIGAFAVAIGYAVNQAIKHWDELTSFFEGTGLTPMLESIGKAAKDAGEVLVGAFVVVKRKVGQAINFVTDLFSDNASELGQIARTAARVVTQGFQALWSRAQTVFSGVADIIGSVIGYMKNAFQFWYNLLTGDPKEALGALERAVKYMALGIVQAIDTMISTVIETVADFVHYIDKAFGTDMEGALDNASKSVSQFAKGVKKELGLEEQQKQIDDTQKSLMNFGGTLENIGSKTLDSLNFGSSGSGSEESEDDGGISKSSTKSGGEDSELQKNEQTPGQAQTIPADQLKNQLKQVQTAMKEQRIAEIWEGVSNRIAKAGKAMKKSFTDQIKMAGKSAKSMANFAAKLGNAVSDSISAFIAEGVTAVVSGALKSSSLLGPAAVPIAASAGAAAQALFSSIVPEFATGGGVQGETLAKMGDYPGSYANPEVALRMDQVQRMVGDVSSGDGGQDVEFVMDGEKLKGVQNSNANRKRRMGL